jgi:hypothetical protein
MAISYKCSECIQRCVQTVSELTPSDNTSIPICTTVCSILSMYTCVTAVTSRRSQYLEGG